MDITLHFGVLMVRAIRYIVHRWVWIITLHFGVLMVRAIRYNSVSLGVCITLHYSNAMVFVCLCMMNM